MRTDAQIGLMKTFFIVTKAEYPSFSNIIRISFGLVLFGAFIMYFFNNTILAGIVLILLGLVLFGMWIKPYLRDRQLYYKRPSEDQMDTWLIEDLNKTIKGTAIEKLRLNKNTLELENFLIIPYPIYWAEPGIDEEAILKRTSENGITYYSVWNVQVIALTKNYISYYTCTYDWINNLVINERTNEFFYDDISSVKNDMQIIERSLKGKTYVDGDGKQLPPDKLTATVFKVLNMSTDSLEVITNLAEMGHSPNIVVSLEKAVQALRIILRKRRYDEEQEPIIVEKNDDDETDENHTNA
ncbi:MAG: hypothetical protein B6I20_14240 [Bacteroidetes bacterium 4572_117]|nr:MAG: hypothetical protein B6I20_14240 [Bacteroidetes bacterium 4572_117]